MVSQPIKIVSIIPYKIFPAQLGGEKGIALFTEYLAAKVSIVAVTTKNNLPQFARGYRLLNILPDSKLRYANMLLFFRLRKLLVSEGATHLLIEHPYFGWLAWMLCRSLRIPWIVHSHNIEYMRSRSIGRWWWKGLRAYEGWVYKKADRVFFISEEDRQHALAVWSLDPTRSQEATYGIEEAGKPTDLQQSREAVMQKHGLHADEKILLFNGALYHSTNYDALRVILDHINPALQTITAFRYKVIVCGKGLPAFFTELREYRDQNIIYAGFVEDISVYFKAADVFLNPILTGGGVKTKAIEALAMNCSVVSTPLGAMGIRREVCGDKLQIVEEGEWEHFAALVRSVANQTSEIPEQFYQHYYWGNIVQRVADAIGNHSTL